MRIHPLADVQSNKIGEGTTIWQFAIILQGAVIGKNCNINCHTFIENRVIIGDNVTVKSGVFLWDDIIIEDDVMIGPNATFTNDKYPRSKHFSDIYQNVRLKKGCSIGANATVLGGVSIGKYAIVGAGSIVTKDVADFALVVGSPAKQIGWIDEKGRKLQKIHSNRWCSVDNVNFQENDGVLTRLDF